MSSAKPIKPFLLIVLSMLSVAAIAAGTPLSPHEATNVAKSATESCVRRNEAGRNLTAEQGAGVRAYCDCFGRTLAKLTNREHLAELQRSGSMPADQPARVKQASDQCMNELGR